MTVAELRKVLEDWVDDTQVVTNDGAVLCDVIGFAEARLLYRVTKTGWVLPSPLEVVPTVPFAACVLRIEK